MQDAKSPASWLSHTAKRSLFLAAGWLREKALGPVGPVRNSPGPLPGTAQSTECGTLKFSQKKAQYAWEHQDAFDLITSVDEDPPGTG
jgi:hypothetical protein